MPSKLKAIIYRLGYPVAKAYWFFRRPNTEGVRCVVINQNKIVLIRHTYGNVNWTVPGGGVKKIEGLKEAARREVKEEIGLNLSKIKKVGEIYNNQDFKKDTVHVFVAETEIDALHLDSSEVKEAVWFNLNNLPKDTSPLCHKFINLVNSAKLSKAN